MMAHGDNRRKCKKRLQQWGFLMIGGAWRTVRNKVLAKREGFEPPIRLPVCRISSAVLSTTQPPLRGRRRRKHPVGRGLCIQRETVKQERPVVRGGSSWRRSQGHGGRP